MLRIDHLTKSFGHLRALDDVSFTVAPGEIVGFVGANGAGKTTTMRITLGALATDAGTVTWQDRPLDLAQRRRIGYMPEERGLYPKMKVGDQLVYLARLHGATRAQAVRAMETWTERLDIATRRGDEVQRLSLGNQQRVQLAAALVIDPVLLVLDEPFSGLDPVAVDVMSSVLRDQADAGVPTLFSSHQLDVVERLCDRVVIIRGGRLVADGTVEELRATEPTRWRVVVDASPEALAGLASSLPGAVMQPEPSGTALTCDDTDDQALLAAAQAVGAVREFGALRPSLTEIFREVVADGAAGHRQHEADTPVPSASPDPTEQTRNVA